LNVLAVEVKVTVFNRPHISRWSALTSVMSTQSWNYNTGGSYRSKTKQLVIGNKGCNQIEICLSKARKSNKKAIKDSILQII